jgi:hypothetical protein
VQISFAEIPDALWERVERWIPKRTKSPKGGRPRVAGSPRDEWHPVSLTHGLSVGRDSVGIR